MSFMVSRSLSLRGSCAVGILFAAGAAAWAVGCSSDGNKSTFDPAGSGADAGGKTVLGTGGNGDSGATLTTTGAGSDASTSTGTSTETFDGTLAMTIRDFRFYDAGDPSTDPDFENTPKIRPDGGALTGSDGTYLGDWDDDAIVTDTLGADGKPVYAVTDGGGTLTTHGKAGFDKWYNDTDGTNIHVDYPLVLTVDGGTYSYDSNISGESYGVIGPGKGFFPIDDGSQYQTAYGNQGWPHNYSFTAELHTTFTYQGGEYFSFRGDDDVFVYINGKRVINLGGIHDPLTASVQADDLGLTKGQDYPLDFFSAERHVSGSNILFTTTLQLRPVTVVR